MGHFTASTSAAAPDRVVVTLAGECDLSVRDEMTAALDAAVRAARVVVVDAARLEFLDSSGMNALIAAYRAAGLAGGRLYLVNATGVVAELLELTGVGALLAPAKEGSDRFPA